ncbi:MAG: AAA family ATPase [Desulfobulbaceae bacterium]|nr:AAA family ATPase [Desulfobulbaceae bacterium]
MQGAENIMLDIAWSSIVAPRYPDILCKDYLPIIKGSVNLISAQGGIGKTFISLINTLFFLKDNPRQCAYLWTTEDDPSLMKTREIAVLNRYFTQGIDFRREIKRLAYGYHHLPFIEKHQGTYRESEFFQAAMQQLTLFDFVVIDPLLNVFGGDNENDNHQARTFMNVLKRAAAEKEKTFLVVHHGRKGDGSMRGASAFQDSSRLAYEILRDETGQIIARMTKSNYTGKYGDVVLNPIPDPRYFPREGEDDTRADGTTGTANVHYLTDNLPF